MIIISVQHETVHDGRRVTKNALVIKDPPNTMKRDRRLGKEENTSLIYWAVLQEWAGPDVMQAFHIPGRYHHHHLEKQFLYNATVFAFAYFQYHIPNRKRKGERAMANKEEKTENVE